MDQIAKTVKLHNGVDMPQFGLGVYKVKDGKEVVNTVKAALQLGYRLIDTASFYDNEVGVGQAIRESGIPRKDLFITTKVWNSDQGYEKTLLAFEKSMEKLQVEYLDLYLIHWAIEGKYIDTWKALEKLYRDGKVRAIGVSNFQTHHLEQLFESCEHKPTVNQIECHPYLAQQELRSFCKQNDIKVEAWSPIARGRILDQPILEAIANNHNKTVAQVVLRWHLQNDVIIIPKSVTPARIKENANIFDFELTADEMKQIDGLNKNERFGPHPDKVDF